MEYISIKFAVDIKLLYQFICLKAGWPSRVNRMKKWATGTSAKFLREKK